MKTSIASKTAPAPRVPGKSVARKPEGNGATPPAAKQASPDKPTRVRGTFVMPEADYSLIAKLKLTAKRNGLKVKKSELLRLGLRAIHSLPASELQDRILSLRLPEKRSRKS